MKILTDFDGTLTNIEHEFNFECHFILRALEERYRILPQETEFLLKLANGRILQAPEKYGWEYGDRISAFCDEDLFMQMASAMTLIDTWRDNPPDEDVAAILRRVPDLRFLGIVEEAHEAMLLEPLCPGNVPDADTVRTIQTLLDRDCEIVVTSNSPADRIISKFEYAGLLPVDHENNPSAHFRVRGGCGKYILGSSPEPIAFGKRTVDVSRPFYADVIREERPQVIIGDAFSLDLALPIHMIRQAPLVYDDMQLYLRTRPYTSQWALDECARSAAEGSDYPVAIRTLADYADLPEMMSRR